MPKRTGTQKLDVGNRPDAYFDRVETVVSEAEIEGNKIIVAKSIEVVWRRGQLEELGTFWTDDCVNHADPAPGNVGLEALRRYHENFGQAFAGFTSPTIEIVQQIAEENRVVTQILTQATHSASGKLVSLSTVRIDRLQNGQIAEHWSVADMAGLMRQIQA